MWVRVPPPAPNLGLNQNAGTGPIIYRGHRAGLKGELRLSGIVRIAQTVISLPCQFVQKMDSEAMPETTQDLEVRKKLESCIESTKALSAQNKKLSRELQQLLKRVKAKPAKRRA